MNRQSCGSLTKTDSGCPLFGPMAKSLGGSLRCPVAGWLSEPTSFKTVLHAKTRNRHEKGIGPSR